MSQEGSETPSAPRRSRWRAAVHFIVAQQVQTVLTVLAGLIATPLLLRWLGAERFGLVRLLEATLALLGVGWVCLGTALGAGLVPRLARGDQPGVRQWVAAAQLLAAGIGVAVLVLAALLVWLGPLGQPASPALQGEWQAAFWLLLGGAALLAPWQLARTVFEADQRGARVSGVLTFSSLLTTAVALLLAARGGGLPGQALAMLCGSALTALWLYAWVRRTYAPWSWVIPPRQDLLTLFHHASRLFLASLCGALAVRCEVLAVQVLYSPEEVTRYHLTQRLYALWQGQLLMLGTAVWAPLADLYVRQERAVLQQRLGQTVAVLCALGCAGGVAALGYTEHFLHLWGVGREQFLGGVAAAAFVLAMPAAALHSLFGWMLTATGHSRQYVVSAGSFALAAVAGCFGLGHLWGPAGVALGMTAAYAVSLLGNLAMLHHLGIFSLSRGLGPALRALLLALPLAWLSWRIGQAHTPWGWLGLLAEMTAWFGTYLLLWLVTAPRQERQIGREFLNRFWPAREKSRAAPSALSNSAAVADAPPSVAVDAPTRLPQNPSR
jgi:O-antigen/teichoic acid export membrane protein